MKKLSFLLLISMMATSMQGQKYLTKNLRAKADSVLNLYMGDVLLNKYFTFDTINAYYEYKNIFNKSHWERLYQNKKTKGKFVKAEARWLVSIPCPKCPVYPQIKTRIGFDLNVSMQPTEKISFNFIPDFFWKGDSCFLMTEDKALAIAKQQKLGPGTEPITTEIYYDAIQKTFFWKMQQTLSRKKDGYNHDYGEMDILVIDASTGKVDSHQTYSYGPVY